jgi:hypothetical protein
VKNVCNQRDKNQFYLNRGEGKEKDPNIRARRKMYIDCRTSYETWRQDKKLPHGAQVHPFKQALPEKLLDHPYFVDPEAIYEELEYENSPGDAQTEASKAPSRVINSEPDTTVVLVSWGKDAKRLEAAGDCLNQLVAQKLPVKIVLMEMLQRAERSSFPRLESKLPNTRQLSVVAKRENMGLWQKEALINLAVAHVDTPHVILMDMDVYSEDPYWLQRIREKLDIGEDMLVQGFSECHDTLEPAKHSFRSCVIHEGKLMTNPGLVWGLHLTTFKRNAGLNPFLIYGGGDGFMVAEYSGRLKPYMTRSPVLKDIVRKNLPVRCELDYVDVPVLHINHGGVGSRNYAARHHMVNYFRPMNAIVEVDSHGLLRWRKPGSPEAEMVARRGEMHSKEAVDLICRTIVESRERD